MTIQDMEVVVKIFKNAKYVCAVYKCWAAKNKARKNI